MSSLRVSIKNNRARENIAPYCTIRVKKRQKINKELGRVYFRSCTHYIVNKTMIKNLKTHDFRVIEPTHRALLHASKARNGDFGVTCRVFAILNARQVIIMKAKNSLFAFMQITHKFWNEKCACESEARIYIYPNFSLHNKHVKVEKRVWNLYFMHKCFNIWYTRTLSPRSFPEGLEEDSSWRRTLLETLPKNVRGGKKWNYWRTHFYHALNSLIVFLHIP